MSCPKVSSHTVCWNGIGDLHESNLKAKRTQTIDGNGEHTGTTVDTHTKNATQFVSYQNICWMLCSIFSEETKQVLRLSLTEFSLPKFYLLFGISKVKSAAVIAFRSSYRDRSFSPGSYERETFALSSLETVTEALLEIMEVSRKDQISFCFSLLLCFPNTFISWQKPQQESADSAENNIINMSASYRAL